MNMAPSIFQEMKGPKMVPRYEHGYENSNMAWFQELNVVPKNWSWFHMEETLFCQLDENMDILSIRTQILNP
jgi:hypothetical protein